MNKVKTMTLSGPGVTALSGPIHPPDLLGMAHSPVYFPAAGVADHDFSWVHATAAKITDPIIHQLLEEDAIRCRIILQDYRYLHTFTTPARRG